MLGGLGRRRGALGSWRRRSGWTSRRGGERWRLLCSAASPRSWLGASRPSAGLGACRASLRSSPSSPSQLRFVRWRVSPGSRPWCSRLPWGSHTFQSSCASCGRRVACSGVASGSSAPCSVDGRTRLSGLTSHGRWSWRSSCCSKSAGSRSSCAREAKSAIALGPRASLVRVAARFSRARSAKGLVWGAGSSCSSTFRGPTLCPSPRIPGLRSRCGCSVRIVDCGCARRAVRARVLSAAPSSGSSGTNTCSADGKAVPTRPFHVGPLLVSARTSEAGVDSRVHAGLARECLAPTASDTPRRPHGLPSQPTLKAPKSLRGRSTS